MMKIAFLSIYKPERGSGDGMTEYAYQLQKRLKSKCRIKCIYAVESAKRNNRTGLLYANTLFKKMLDKENLYSYDIIHITTHELGFAAKLLREKGTSARIIVTIHDFARMKKELHKGVQQRLYNAIVRNSTKDAVESSDLILFNSKKTMEEAEHFFPKEIRSKKYRVVYLGIDDSFIKDRIRKKESRKFTVGYVGSLAYHKNAIFLLKVANLMKKDRDIIFKVYGNGSSYRSMVSYKAKNRLSNANLLGFADQKKITGIYDSFDVFVYPSIYEGFGYIILQAQARGIPVITFRGALIPKEVAKYCISVTNEKQAALAIKRIKENGYGAKLRIAAMRHARSFTMEKTSAMTFKAYIDAVKQR